MKHSLGLFAYFLYLTILLLSQLPAVVAAPLECFSLWMKINSLATVQISFEHITKCWKECNLFCKEKKTICLQTSCITLFCVQTNWYKDCSLLVHDIIFIGILLTYGNAVETFSLTNRYDFGKKPWRQIFKEGNPRPDPSDYNFSSTEVMICVSILTTNLSVQNFFQTELTNWLSK